jgi:undecaprenyl diphosphate synthase
MDGNGRWAKRMGQARVFGHESGVKSVKIITEACAELGIEYLTLYAFSTENWNRPAFEVNALMELLVNTIHAEIDTLMDNEVRLLTIGDIESMDQRIQNELSEAMQKTSANKRMALLLALNYSSKWEITDAVRKISRLVNNGIIKPEDIDQDLISSNLNTSGIPDPELLIRTSGESRISNFLLWQIAYSELYFTPKLWPDFGKEELYEAIVNFQCRERRFGMISEQLNSI